MNKKIENLIKESFEQTIKQTFHKNNESKKHFINKENVLKPDEINFSTEFSKIFEENSNKEGNDFFSISEFKYNFIKDEENDENEIIDIQKILDYKSSNDIKKHFDKNKKMFFDSLSFNNSESIIFEFKKNTSGTINNKSIIDLSRIIYLMKSEKIKFGFIGAFPTDLKKIDRDSIIVESIEKDFKDFNDIATYSYLTIKKFENSHGLIFINNFCIDQTPDSKDDISKKIFTNYFILDIIDNYAKDIINDNNEFLDQLKENELFILIEEFYPENNTNSYKDELLPNVINSIISNIDIKELNEIFVDINLNDKNILFKKEFFNQDIFNEFSIPEIFKSDFNHNEKEIFSKLLDKLKKNSDHINNIFKRNLDYKKKDKNIDDTIHYTNNRTFIIISSWNKILNNKIYVKKKKIINLEKSLYKSFGQEEANKKIFELGFKSIIFIGLYIHYIFQEDKNNIEKYEKIKSQNKKINKIIKKLKKFNNNKNNIKNEIDISKFDNIESFSEKIIEIIFSEND